MRVAFIETLTRLAREDKNIWLMTGDLGYSVVENFATTLPNQYLNAGVAEQNMVGMAAGLALCGKSVFVYSIVPFITLRCLEQVRNDLCMQNVNVKLVGYGEGFTNSLMGATHHSVEDIAVMRALPNMTVVCPGDPWEVEKAVVALCKNNSPAYLRLGKSGEPILHKEYDGFALGKGSVIRDGNDLTIISTGNMLEESQKAAEILAKRGILAKLISMHTVKPVDKTLIVKSAMETGVVITIEEHSIIGGLGSTVAEVLLEAGFRGKFKAFGVADKYTKIAGSQAYLRKVNGLSAVQIAEGITKLLKK